MTDPWPNLGLCSRLFTFGLLVSDTSFISLSPLLILPPLFQNPLLSPPTCASPSADVPFCSFAPALRHRTKLSPALTDSDVIASRQVIANCIIPQGTGYLVTEGSPLGTHGNIRHHLNPWKDPYSHANWPGDVLKPWVISNICSKLHAVHTSTLAHMESHTTYVFLVIYGQESVWESKIQKVTLSTQQSANWSIGCRNKLCSYSVSGQGDKVKKGDNE